MEENRFLKQAKEELAYLSDDPDFQLIVDARVRMLRDISSFRRQCEREAKEKTEIKIKETEAKVKETEAKVKETEAKVKETEAKVKEAEAKVKEAEAKVKEAEAKIKEKIADGRAEGENHKQIEIAKKMKWKNISIKEIAELTDLTIEEIEKL